jgi:hypothetical protein
MLLGGHRGADAPAERQDGAATGATDAEATGSGPVTAPVPETAECDGERAEIVLAGRLLDGNVSAAEYHRAMAVLAAGDAQRHPLVAPPHGGD